MKNPWNRYTNGKSLWTVGVAVITIIVGWIAIENHFANEGELLASEQRQQQKLEIFQMKTNTTFDIFLLDKLNQEIMTYKRMCREYPNDEELKDLLKEALDYRDEVKKRISERLKTE